jgi:hypothetical protein
MQPENVSPSTDSANWIIYIIRLCDNDISAEHVIWNSTMCGDDSLYFTSTEMEQDGSGLFYWSVPGTSIREVRKTIVVGNTIIFHTEYYRNASVTTLPLHQFSIFYEQSRFVSNLLTFILQSVLRQVRSLFQSQFSTGCDLVLPLSIYSIFSFP